MIAKDTISRYHARIECENSDYYLEDLNSTNGTFVNEKQLTYKEKRKLESNDIIRFADVKYRFV
jgi:pSer/pThr/pTyr-binding forkhead associated (FHA) protein